MSPGFHLWLVFLTMIHGTPGCCENNSPDVLRFSVCEGQKQLIGKRGLA